MNEPMRLSSGGSPLAKQLLRAGRAERPREDAKVEAIAAAAVVAAKSRGLFLLSSKWGWLVGLGLALAGGVGAAALAAPPRWTADARPAVGEDELLVDRAGPLFEPRAIVPGPLATSERGNSPAASAAPTAAAPARVDPSLPVAVPTELELVRRARIASVNGDPRSALQTLDEHARLYPTGALREEADALRVEVLVRSGDADGARRAASHFLRTYPRSPYFERVSALVRGSATKPSDGR